MTPPPSPAVVADIAPAGTLNVGLNMANFLLTGRDPATNEPRGIAIDLARELAGRLGVPVKFICYDAPGPMADAAGTGAWNVAFLAAEPARAQVIAFSAAYLEIEATYLVPPGSPLTSVADVDRAGVRISTMHKSAYELYLTRNLKHAQLVMADSIEASYTQFVESQLEALSGLRPRLVSDAARLPGSRILEGRFTAVQQAIGMPRKSEAAAQYLRAFVEDAKATGLVADVIARNGVKGVSVAAAAP
jgi:polar amino acid transport system substrate-binding protein